MVSGTTSTINLFIDAHNSQRDKMDTKDMESAVTRDV